METFGWKQVKSTANVNGARSPHAGGGEESLPNPKKANAALPLSIKRFDTETPAGRDDPGMDDERTGDGISLDVGHYRVDDYIDETSAEARNRADAIEDGVEGAIAAASGRLGMGTRAADHFGYRESQTLSGTLPYARGSIYHTDNPLGTNSTKFEGIDRGDRDDDIDRGNPAKVVDGEDELIAAMAREQQRTQTPTAAAAKKTDLDRYSTERSKYSQDANWVQFHLDANEAIWKKFTTRDNLKRRLSDSVMKLKADASVAIRATDNQNLRSVLSQLQE